MNVLCCVPFRPLCRLTKYTVVGTALGPTLTVGMLAVGPGNSQVFFFPQATSIDSPRSVPRTAVVMHLDPLWELWGQLRLWPGPTSLCRCPKSPHLLKPDSSQLQEHLLSVHMFHRC